MIRAVSAALAAATLLASGAVAAGQAADPRRDAGGYPAPTTALERGRRVYVLSSCHFCHGVDLTGAQMGAADLMHDALVAADQHGEVIGAIVRAGLPNLQTAMPRYVDMTPQQVQELAAYIHFLRAQGRFRELTEQANQPSGDTAAGKTYFSGEGGCAKCHSLARDLAGVGKKYGEARLLATMLRPAVSVPREGVEMSAGGAAHQKLLETMLAKDAQNVLAYLREQ